MTTSIKKEKPPEPSVDVSKPQQNAQEKLPVELALMTVAHLMPKDAIQFEATSHAGRDLIANNPQVWMKHGVRPPVAANGTLKQTWMSQARTLPPEIQEALSTLTRPLDIFSTSAVAVFSSAIQELHKSLANRKFFMDQKVPLGMRFAHRDAVLAATQAGVKVPIVSEEMRNVYLASIDEGIANIKIYAQTGSADAIEGELLVIRICAQEANVPMPTLPVREIKSAYGKQMVYYLEMAQGQVLSGDFFRMGHNLKTAADAAKQADVEMPALSLEGATQEAKDAYWKAMDTLKPKK